MNWDFSKKNVIWSKFAHWCLDLVSLVDFVGSVIRTNGRPIICSKSAKEVRVLG